MGRSAIETGDNKASNWPLKQLVACANPTKPKRVCEQAVTRWLKEKARKATIESDRMHLRWLDRHLRGMELNAIDRTVIDTLIEARQHEDCSNATVNRTMEVVRAILRKAVNEWEWIERAPSIRLLPEPKRGIRWLTHEEAETLITELPDHLAEVATIHLSNRTKESQCHGARVAAGGPRAPCRLDPR